MAAQVIFKPSRTFALAAFGLMALCLLAVGLFGVLAWCLAGSPFTTPDGELLFAELPGQIVTALQVVAGCLATVATAGAGSMAARDYASKGLTSSQAHQVLAGRPLRPGPPPVPARTHAGPAAPVPPGEEETGSLEGP